MNTALKELFLLDPSVTFLNHGSFGACPLPVFEAYQSWQRELEHQPVEFLGRRANALMAEARTRLANYLGAEADEVVYFPNPTTAINMTARHLAQWVEKHTGKALQPGDEILSTDHEYGAMDRTWRYVCRQSGVRYVNHPIPLPIEDPAQCVETFWAGVNQHTRVVFISHLTSPTALIFPVAEICRRAREAGLLTIIDGAHAPGQIPLNLNELGADVYTGACHKWLMAAKGSAFLYVRRELQEGLDPLVVSWGYESTQPGPSRFVDYHEWQGTRDLAAFLSVPAAIDFQIEQHWDAVRDRCHHLAVDARRRINALTGLPPICPESSRWFGQMFAARLPAVTDLASFKTRLYDEFRIEVPMIDWNGQKFIRVSVQGYNTQQDIDCLLNALQVLLPTCR
jgi:isopenicillin-N epimerase